jgi:hypothetical protein
VTLCLNSVLLCTTFKTSRTAVAQGLITPFGGRAFLCSTNGDFLALKNREENGPKFGRNVPVPVFHRRRCTNGVTARLRTKPGRSRTPELNFVGGTGSGAAPRPTRQEAAKTDVFSHSHAGCPFSRCGPRTKARSGPLHANGLAAATEHRRPARGTRNGLQKVGFLRRPLPRAYGEQMGRRCNS